MVLVDQALGHRRRREGKAMALDHLQQQRRVGEAHRRGAYDRDRALGGCDQLAGARNGPIGSLSVSARACARVSAIRPRSSRSVALVIGLNSVWWSIHIWMRRPIWSVLRSQVSAISGERSRKAQPTPVARLVAPGPSVAMHRPGAPVRRPVTSAAKPAEPSWAVSTKSSPPRRIASMRGRTLPLGMPKPRWIPAAFRVATIRSALFMKLFRLGRNG